MEKEGALYDLMIKKVRDFYVQAGGFRTNIISPTNQRYFENIEESSRLSRGDD